MNRQSAAVNIIRFFTQQVEQLRVDHADQEIEATVCIGHHQKQSGFFISQRVQLQFIVHGDLADILNVERGKTGTGRHKNTF